MSCENYSELFINQFIKTLAQLSAVLVSGSLAVPAYTFYMKRTNDLQHINSVNNVDDTVLLNETDSDTIIDSDSTTEINDMDLDPNMDIVNNEQFVNH
jgi:hypothetical protein